MLRSLTCVAMLISLSAPGWSAEPAPAVDGDVPAVVVERVELSGVVHGHEWEPASDGSSTSLLSSSFIRSLPGGATRSLNDVVSTQGGITPDSFGSIHARGYFLPLQLRLDGVMLPPAIEDRLQQLLESQIVQEARVILGGVPAEYGNAVAGVIDVTTLPPGPVPSGEARISYGTFNTIEGQANASASLGPVGVTVAGSVTSTERGLDPPSAGAPFHDQFLGGRAFLQAEWAPSASNRLQLLGVYAESHFQIPIDPTMQPLSAAPPGAIRGNDIYGNTPPVFVPLDSNPTELERDLFFALTWDHDFGGGAHLQAGPFVRYEDEELLCDTRHQLGPEADPGTICSDVHHRQLQWGAFVNQSWHLGAHEIKIGASGQSEGGVIAYTAYARNDASAIGGIDPAQTASGQDDVDVLLGGIYLQDRIVLGRLTLLPGLRLDAQRATVEHEDVTLAALGPGVRFGASYAISHQLLLRAFVGHLWQPPVYDAATAARVLGLVPPGQPVPYDLKPETDEVAEVGLTATVLPRLRLTFTIWGRLSEATLDDNEVGDTALVADFNYARGRAAGAELGGSYVWRTLRVFANVSTQTSQGQGLISARYLFTPQQLAFTGWQMTDNTQALTANSGFDLSDESYRFHFSGLVRFGSGLRTGPTNNETLPPAAVFDASLRYSFDLPLHPEIAFDVGNLFNVIYAYRIGTGSLTGSAYGETRTLNVRFAARLGN